MQCPNCRTVVRASEIRLVSTSLRADAGPSSSAPAPLAETTAAQAEKAIEVFGSYSTKACPSVSATAVWGLA